jgi:hypothetical protein
MAQLYTTPAMPFRRKPNIENLYCGRREVLWVVTPPFAVPAERLPPLSYTSCVWVHRCRPVMGCRKCRPTQERIHGLATAS